ncbi:hypothetical protein O9992_27525 [Vibrio lentus]|nr:hypothetical protein [Vibrio lentus]
MLLIILSFCVQKVLAVVPRKTLSHKVDPAATLSFMEEGAKLAWDWPGLSFIWTTMGAIGFSRFNRFDTPIEATDMTRIKLLRGDI